jgi:hypothetical protein
VKDNFVDVDDNVDVSICELINARLLRMSKVLFVLQLLTITIDKGVAEPGQM